MPLATKTSLFNQRIYYGVAAWEKVSLGAYKIHNILIKAHELIKPSTVSNLLNFKSIYNLQAKSKMFKIFKNNKHHNFHNTSKFNQLRLKHCYSKQNVKSFITHFYNTFKITMASNKEQTTIYII